MYTEFAIDINGKYTNIYMQSGFFDHSNMSYPLHKHAFSEIHILLSGNAVLRCDGEDVVLNKGDVLLIPTNVMHTYQTCAKDSKRLSFFVDDDKHFQSISKSAIPQSMLPLLCEEIQAYVLFGRDAKLRSLLSYICCDFFAIEKQATPITNRELIIENFFFQKYNQKITLDDLAKELMLSHKQTEREVRKITGNTFTDELTKRRINAAIMLSQTTDITLAEISELVGYSSYCGFYKAFKRVQNRTEEK